MTVRDDGHLFLRFAPNGASLFGKCAIRKDGKSAKAEDGKEWCIVRHGVGVGIMKEFAAKLYKSRQWQKTREAYAKSVGYLCEDCLKKGLYKPGEIVHHRTHLTPENITDPRIALDWNNLRLVCRDCHASIHKSKGKFNYYFDENGNVLEK